MVGLHPFYEATILMVEDYFATLREKLYTLRRKAAKKKIF